MTHRIFDHTQLVLATHNDGKIKEFSLLLGDFATNIRSARDMDLPEPEETGTSFEENAALKAHAAAQATKCPALADDSGLAVDALNGEPGIYSARWAETDQGRDFDYAMQLINEKLSEQSNRRAKFVAVLCLAWPDGHIETVRGEVHGDLTWPPRGTYGFGYDPMFIPDGDTRTFGEMPPEDKKQYSHRAIALQKLIDQCFRQAA